MLSYLQVSLIDATILNRLLSEYDIMSWPYKKVLVIGATSGIGEALAARCVRAGSQVIVSGRREERLIDFVHQHGKEQSSVAPFDITALDKIPDFAAKCVAIRSSFEPLH